MSNDLARRPRGLAAAVRCLDAQMRELVEAGDRDSLRLLESLLISLGRLAGDRCRRMGMEDISSRQRLFEAEAGNLLMAQRTAEAIDALAASLGELEVSHG